MCLIINYDFLKHAIKIGKELSNVVFVFMKVGVKQIQTN
jgi:hypothetical protein